MSAPVTDRQLGYLKRTFASATSHMLPTISRIELEDEFGALLIRLRKLHEKREAQQDETG